MSSCRFLAAGAVALALAATASADPVFDTGLNVSLGTFALTTTTQLRVDGATNGDQVDAEKDLGLTDSDQLRVDLDWRFAQNHKLRVMWFTNDRSATKTLAQDTTIGNTTALNGTSVTTTMKTDILELAYEYSLFRGDDWEATGSAGLHSIILDYDVDGAINTPSEAKVTGPLPVFGARGQWRFGSDWYLDAQAQAQVFGLQYGDISGRIDD